MRPGAGRITLTVLCCALALFATADSAVSDNSASPSTRTRFEPEELLMSAREAEVFRELRHPRVREKFLERFWSERASEVREDWNKRLPLASSEFSDLSSDRARLFLTAGPPLYRVADICPAPVAPHEIWYYGEGGTQTVTFVSAAANNEHEAREENTEFEIWQQDDWTRILPASGSDPQAELLSSCTRGPELVAALLGSLGSLGSDPPQPAADQDAQDPNWVDGFLPETTLLPRDARPLKASIDLDYPVGVGDRTAVVITLGVALDSEPASPAPSFSLTGEVFDTEAVDAFRLQLSATRGSRDEPARLTVRRHLPPGRFTMILKLHDEVADTYLRSTLNLEVPTLENQESGWVEPGQCLFILTPPREGYLTGSHRFHTIVSNSEISKVTFFLDSERALTKNRPPFSVELDLGVVPRPREVEAIAYDANGYELARDRITINSGPHRFSIRLVQPGRGAQTGSSTRVHAEVETPLGEKLSHVDFFWNEARLARLYQPPFVHVLQPAASSGSSYVRAVAVLEDGHSAEDLVVVNTGDTIEAIDVDFVELYASVLGEGGTAVKGLDRDEFRVFEDDVEQELRRFETVENLPINAVVMLDSSTSMTEEIEEAEKAAAKFFEDVLEPKDRAAVVVFNDVPSLRVALTNDTVLLKNGLAGIDADGETSLYDSLIYGLYYLAGLRGKRALILLSDGADSVSEFSFDDALEYAKRSGVAIYTIGLGLRNDDVSEYAVLRRLSRETGGESFFVESARRLDRIYTRIEDDLRSQYLLGYQSPQLESRDYREVRVEVTRKGLEAKTVPGYYP